MADGVGVGIGVVDVISVMLYIISQFIKIWAWEVLSQQDFNQFVI